MLKNADGAATAQAQWNRPGRRCVRNDDGSFTVVINDPASVVGKCL